MIKSIFASVLLGLVAAAYSETLLAGLLVVVVGMIVYAIASFLDDEFNL